MRGILTPLELSVTAVVYGLEIDYLVENSCSWDRKFNVDDMSSKQNHEVLTSKLSQEQDHLHQTQNKQQVLSRKSSTPKAVDPL